MKLVERVAGAGSTGFDWHGRFLSSGGLVRIGELPDPCLVLESLTVPPHSPAGAVRRNDVLYILWAFERARVEWRELARVQLPPTGAGGLADLAPVARRALRQGMRVVRLPDEVAMRIAMTIRDELSALESREQRAQALALLHDHGAALRDEFL